MAPESASRSHSSPEPSTLSTPTPACSLGANPFPEVTDLFCRLPLPTLFCRPEAFSLGDRLRLTVRTGARERDLPWIFQAHPQDTLLHERSAAFQDSKPCPSMMLFKGRPVLQKETTASSGCTSYKKSTDPLYTGQPFRWLQLFAKRTEPNAEHRFPAPLALFGIYLFAGPVKSQDFGIGN